MQPDSPATTRDVLFISKATPEDDEFVLWLAPRLEAAGYKVFADILTLEPGDRWRKRVTSTLQDLAVKMLLCCRDASLAKDGVQEEIGIGLDLTKQLPDPNFIIPLRIEKYKKLFGIGEIQWVNFLGSWANGLHDLLEALKDQNVPRQSNPAINPNWENYRQRLAIKLENTPETLTSNWLRIAAVPDVIRYFQPTGSVNHPLMESTCKTSKYPASIHLRGFFSFATLEEVNEAFASVGKFEVHSEHKFLEFVQSDTASPAIRQQEAKNLVTAMFRQSWENFCRGRGLHEYAFSKQLGFHVCEAQMALGKRVSWGRQGKRRNSMLRNKAAGKVWQYGVSANPALWPYPHFKLKSRVLFAELAGKGTGKVFDDADQQHKFRRSVCKGWRNKAWHGRLMAFLELLSGDLSYIDLELSGSASFRLDATPILFTSPVSTVLPDEMSDDAEEQDDTTLGNFHVEEDE
jgi:TIR domain